MITWFTALFCPLIGLAVIVTIIVLIVRNVGSGQPGAASVTPPPPPPPPRTVATQLAQDGFWLSSFAPLSTISYHYWSAGAKYSGQVRFQPGNDGRQFIYTGVRPDEVAIVQVIDPDGGVSSFPPPMIDDGPDVTGPTLGGVIAGAALEAALSTPQPPPPPPEPSQFPPAY